LKNSPPVVTTEEIKEYGGVKFKQPYKLGVYHFKVKEKIYSIYKEDMISFEGTDIEVWPGNSDTMLDITAEYYRDGTMISPYSNYYESSIKFENEKEMIIFVRRRDGKKLIFSAESAYESVKKRREIEKLCEKEIKERGGVELIDTYEEDKNGGPFKFLQKFFKRD